MGGQFAIGIYISGNNRDVRAIEEGEVIFTIDEERFPNNIPSGVGNLIVLHHGDGLISGYAHLESGTLYMNDSEEFSINRGGIIGRVGDSGWTYGRRLGLMIFDSEFNQFVNPLLVLPSINDTEKPVIRDLRLAFGDQITKLVDMLVVESGKYELHGDIYDISEHTHGFTTMAPFSITVYMNGAEMNRFSFKSLQEVEDKIILQTSEGITAEDMYVGDRTVNLGKYDISPGNMSIEIIVADYSGNETGTISNFTVSGP